jgi:hypothetical protein
MGCTIGQFNACYYASSNKENSKRIIVLIREVKKLERQVKKDVKLRTKLSCIFGTDDLNEVERQYIALLQEKTRLETTGLNEYSTGIRDLKDLLREAVGIIELMRGLSGVLPPHTRQEYARLLEKCKEVL